jgi:hypothetical protein
MIIMAILAALILGTTSAALEAGRRSRTEVTIGKIHSLIMERWSSYQTRRAVINPLLISNTLNKPPYSTDPVRRGKALADLRLLAVRELMKYEMPESWANVVESPIVLASAPPLAKTYNRFATSLDPRVLAQSNDAAECLYLTVMYATGDGEARTHFSPQDIGDLDGDGAPEFLDGWGRPILWLRWPAGFVSSLQSAKIDPNKGVPVRPVLKEHDPNDPFRRDQAGVRRDNPYSGQLAVEIAGLDARNRNGVSAYLDLVDDNSPPSQNGVSAYRLTPLVYSTGSDAAAGILNANNGRANSSGQAVSLDPYALAGSGITFQPGTVIDDPTDVTTPIPAGNAVDAKDNIHNHLIEY